MDFDPWIWGGDGARRFFGSTVFYLGWKYTFSDCFTNFKFELKETWKYRWMSWSSQMHINIQLAGAPIVVETSSKHENKAYKICSSNGQVWILLMLP